MTSIHCLTKSFMPTCTKLDSGLHEPAVKIRRHLLTITLSDQGWHCWEM